MTTKELRAHPEYKVCIDKIIGYTPGFKFTLNYTTIPTAKANALKLILRDAVEEGYLESISMGYDLDMNLTDETFRRTELGRLVPMPGTTAPDWGRKHWGKEN